MKEDIRQIEDDYDVFLVDMYGVLYERQHIFPTALQNLERLTSRGKEIIVVSNMTKLPIDAIQHYEAKGLIQGKHFTHFVSSGEVTKYILNTDSYKGSKISQIFLKNEVLFSELDNVHQTDIAQAQYVYIGVPKASDNTDIDISDLYDFHGNIIPFDSILSADWPSVTDSRGISILKNIDHLLRKLKESSKTLICANPDLCAEESQKAVLRQGMIASYYEKLGGNVVYTGKPFRNIFDYVFQVYPHIKGKRIAMVGDTPWTDIAGANSIPGISSVMTLTGMYQIFLRSYQYENSAEHLKEFLHNFSPKIFTHNKNVTPNVIIKRF